MAERSDGDAVLSRIVAWADRTPEVRAVVLTSSRARPGASVDAFSDYDVILAVTDPDRFATDLAWQADAYPEPLVRWGDETGFLGHRSSFRGVIHADQTKVDYMIWSLALVDAVGRQPTPLPALDHGYRVLRDPDGRTHAWPEPTFTAHVLAAPSEAEYRQIVEQFWWDSSYVAKAIGRGELFFANSFVLEHDLKLLSLRQMLEWRIAAAHDWAFAPPPHGRGLERHLDEVTLRDLAATYAAYDSVAIRTAHGRLIELFRRVASDVATALGYAYPQEIDDTMTTSLRAGPHRRGAT